VFTGASTLSVADDQVLLQEVDSEKQETVIVVQEAESDEGLKKAAGGERRMIAMSMDPEAKRKYLAKFAEDHPTADADADGQVSQTEHGAYLVALAMSDPKAVLKKYPKADRNEDDALDAIEAARLVQGGGEERMVLRADRPQAGTRVVVRKEADAKGKSEEKAEKRVMRGGGGAVMLGGAGGSMMVGAPGLVSPAGKWLLRNVSATPSTSDVARFIPAVKQAPLVAFLERNPDADANGDGKLTAEERDAYLERMRVRFRAKMLERHPEADENGDGVLTEEELRNYWKNRSRDK